MNRIDERFSAVKAEGRKALITLLTVGDPNIEVSKQAVFEMQKEGVDIIEFGVPFSDPAADGPIIQRADERALVQGVDIFKVFELVQEIRNDVKVPIVFSLYYNVVVQYGIEKFFERCKEAGVDGVIIPDLPYEESDEIKEYTEKYGVYQISFVSPTSNDRIESIAKAAKGFLYCISSLGVNGGVTDFDEFVSTIKKYTDVPACVSFDALNSDEIKEFAKYFDGAIVGSSVVKAIADGDSAEERINNLREKIKDLKSGL